MKLGIVSYDHTHLKTEQLVNILVLDKRIKKIIIFGLPYLQFKKRDVLFQHRPDMSTGVSVKNLSELHNVSFRRWDGKEFIGNECDLFVIGGAGILDVSLFGGKPIVNGHPGIIPRARGLDCFKWAIYNNDPLGITMHLIDQNVDKGEILEIQLTPIFPDDDIDSLARRHYELEIQLLSKVLDLLYKRGKPVEVEKPATMRMPLETEYEMLKRFDIWKDNMIAKK